MLPQLTEYYRFCIEIKQYTWTVAELFWNDMYIFDLSSTDSHFRPLECPSSLNMAWETLLQETQYDAQVSIPFAVTCTLQ